MECPLWPPTAPACRSTQHTAVSSWATRLCRPWLHTAPCWSKCTWATRINWLTKLWKRYQRWDLRSQWQDIHLFMWYIFIYCLSQICFFSFLGCSSESIVASWRTSTWASATVSQTKAWWRCLKAAANCRDSTCKRTNWLVPHMSYLLRLFLPTLKTFM